MSYKEHMRRKHGHGRQYGEKMGDIKENHVQRYNWAAARLKQESVIDCGCGIGYGSRILSVVCERVWAIDFSESLILDAQEHWDAPNIRWGVQDLNMPDFEGYTAFDSVVCFEVLEHLVNPHGLLAALWQPGRRLFCSVPNANFYGQPTLKGNPFHVAHYTQIGFEDLLMASGWKPTTIEFQGLGKVGNPIEPQHIVIEAEAREGDMNYAPGEVARETMRRLQQRVFDLCEVVRG